MLSCRVWVGHHKHQFDQVGWESSSSLLSNYWFSICSIFTWERSIKTANKTMDVSISPISSVNLASFFPVLSLGWYTIDIIMSSWRIYAFITVKCHLSSLLVILGFPLPVAQSRNWPWTESCGDNRVHCLFPFSLGSQSVGLGLKSFVPHTSSSFLLVMVKGKSRSCYSPMAGNRSVPI